MQIHADKIIIGINGAMGDLLCATPLFRNIKRLHPTKKLIVVNFYPRLLLNNPNVDLSTLPTNEYNVPMINVYKYGFEQSFLGTYSEAWCKSFGIFFEKDELEYYTLPDEDNAAASYISQFNKPIILVAPGSGYAFRNGKRVKITANRDWNQQNWEILCSKLRKDHTIVQVGAKDEIKLKNADRHLLGDNIRFVLALLKKIKLWISVDSFIQHAGTAVGTKGIVLFGKSVPEIAGHSQNINIYKNACNNQICHRNGEIRSLWNTDIKQCSNRNCMKAIKVNEVIDIVNNWSNAKYLDRKQKEYGFIPEMAITKKDTKPQNGRVEIEIPTCDRHGYVAALLANLRNQTYKNFDLTIIDDGADESIVQNQQILDTLKLLEADGHRWRLIRGVRQGPPIAHQKVLDETEHEFVLIIGDDCLIPPDYLEKLYKTIRKNKNIAAVGGICLHLPQLLNKEYYSKKHIQDALTGDPFRFMDLQWRKHPDNRLKSVCHLYGGFIYRTEALKSVGGFPKYLSRVGHREETDTTIRLWLAGYKLYVDPTIEFFHFRARSGGIRNWNKKELFDRDDKTFWKKLEEYKIKYNYKGQK